MSAANDHPAPDRDESATEAVPNRGRKRRFILRWLLRFVFGLIVTGLAMYYFDTKRSEAEVAALVADLDENDPGWRLEELEAARPEIPDSRNSARLSRDLAKLLEPSWPDAALDERMKDAPLAELLGGERVALLEAEMKRLDDVRRAARPMADMPEGRHRIAWGGNLLETKLPDQSDARRVGKLFDYEMLYRANKGDIGGAMRAGRAALCTARSLSDEPLMISQLVRASIVNHALSGIERTLSLGTAAESDLTALDELLAGEEEHNGYLAGVRGERGAWYIMFSRLAAGELPVDPSKGEATWWDRANLFGRMHLKRNQPPMMRFMNRWVEIARLQAHEQSVAEAVLLGEIEEHRKTAPLAVLLMPAANRLGRAWRWKRARVASMRGLIAAERYRMKRGEWPARLADVVPEFLKAVPTDPFDGKPIRMARVPGGVVVYSVGADGNDGGGNLDRENPAAPWADLGFQAWDVDGRGRPASPVDPEGQP